MKHPKTKLIIGFIFKNEAVLSKAIDILRKYFGKIDFESQIIDFNFTTYYQKEIGTGLKRKFISFNKLIDPAKLPDIKILANKIEGKFSVKGNRCINIDPGYIDLAKLVLASTKDFTHRIYLNKGIYAEITLFYQGNSFKSWDLTYPDYRTDKYIEIFNRLRQIYAQQIK